MTTEQEEQTAIIRARDFLVRLMDPRQTTRIPKHIREEARSILKHYPINPYARWPHDHDHLEEQ